MFLCLRIVAAASWAACTYRMLASLIIAARLMSLHSASGFPACLLVVSAYSLVILITAVVLSLYVARDTATSLCILLFLFLELELVGLDLTNWSVGALTALNILLTRCV
ncbi:hypothetical protein B0H17DRAFT_1201913 [Mycena rosella]|uniref:Uncharacterized protein n=1 Tax=Mycena rosella TaxID=1033263 RepID=A0AAD7GI44_MYCRO|nr:hypothetical protein B0H17DRAFT_1201913 [Mycena rosella]